MRIQIISDGMPGGTKVVDQDSGEELEQIRSIKWWIEVDDIGRCLVEFVDVPVQVIGETDDGEQ